jgi:uncharacterized protein YebE (UPF0316 family)
MMDFLKANWYEITFCFFIFFAKVAEISIQSIKLVFLVKNQRLKATMLAFTECMIWGFVVSGIITSLKENLFWLFAYCLGYASGVYFGSIIQEKMAIGTVSIQLIAKSSKLKTITDYLVEKHYGYTILDGHGYNTTSNLVIIVVKRKDEKSVLKDITNLCGNDIFVISSEVSNTLGGYGLRK